MNATFERLAEIFARRQAGLPEYVEAELAACTVTTRDTDDGESRAVIMGLGGRAIYRDQIEARIRKRWPELNHRQVQRACDFLDARVRLEATPSRQARRRSSWIWNF